MKERCAAGPDEGRDAVGVFFGDVLKRSGRIFLKCRGAPMTRQRAACALYFTALLEDANALLHLVADGCAFSVPKLLRAVLECAATLGNLERDGDYAEYLVFESAYKKLRHFREARELMAAPEYAGRFSIRESDMRRLERFLEECSARWKKPLSFEEKFRRAGMEPLYVLYYSLLCDDAHAAFLNLAEGATRGAAACRFPEVGAATVAVRVLAAARALASGAKSVARVFAVDAAEDLLLLARRIVRFEEAFCPASRPGRG